MADSIRPARKTKKPVLLDRIKTFVDDLAKIKGKPSSAQWESRLKRAWAAEIEYHIKNGRTQKTIELYIVKYRQAIKSAYGETSPFLAYCNMKNLKERYSESEITPPAAKSANMPPSVTVAPVGRKPTLKWQLESFIQKLEKAKKEAEMRKIWNEELEKLAGKSETTLISYITKYRNHIKRFLSQDHPALEFVIGSKDLYEDARKRKLQIIADKNAALILFKSWKEVLNICIECLSSKDPLIIGIGLIGTTGRRPFEVFTQAQFYPAPYDKGVSKWSVLFNGQAKTKEREGTKFGLTYEIPVLAPATKVLEAHRRLRESANGEQWSKMNLDEFSVATRIQLRDAVLNLFEKIWPPEEPAKPYGLRHLYAEIAYQNFAPLTVSKNSYYAAILGHNNNDLETSLSYMTYCLPGDVEDAQTRAERLNKRTVSRLKEFI
ncbi:protelomerase family protein [Oryzifoliimicrobium ureilyticus]|uniref:protelomerase family protein n=1 Tax=Oryzifoliimicrobium ureilyticus TaxID=3113724 RepID=UPI003075FD89